MPTGIRKCKVCGCEYPYCKTNRRAGVFRYQDVACCPEHGEIYLAQILESRSAPNEAMKNEDITSNDSPEIADIYEDDNSEIDDLFEGEFEDDEDELTIETK